ncbi:MAG: hypothetical protein ACI30W_01985, partial [Muribaculaceae bacterium]
LAPPANAQQPYRLPWFCLPGNTSLTADMRAPRSHRRPPTPHLRLRPPPSEPSECSESATTPAPADCSEISEISECSESATDATAAPFALEADATFHN